jgi:hypothetical protein
LLIKARIPTLINKYIDQEIYNIQARDYVIYLIIDDREIIILFYLKEKSIYPRNLRTYIGFITSAADRPETIILLKLFKHTFPILFLINASLYCIFNP